MSTGSHIKRFEERLSQRFKHDFTYLMSSNLGGDRLLELIIWARDEARWHYPVDNLNAKEEYESVTEYAYQVSRHLITVIYPAILNSIGRKDFDQLMAGVDEEEKTHPTDKLRLIKLAQGKK